MIDRGKRNRKNLSLNLILSYCIKLIITMLLFLGALVLVLQATTIFDANLGFPGEGSTSTSHEPWSSDEPTLSMTTWNVRSLTFERFYFCKSLNYDVLALTEL